jgi:ribosomal protein L7/L12
MRLKLDRRENEMTDLLLQTLALANALKAHGGLSYCVSRANNIARDLLEEIVRETESVKPTSRYDVALADNSMFAYYTLTKEERKLILDGSFIDAVKSVRADRGIGLKEAKDVCDGFRDKHMVYMGVHGWKLKD